MMIHNLYACVVDNKIGNIIVISADDLYIATQLAKASFGETAFAVECTQYKVNKGDYYIDGVFYKADSEDPSKPGDVIYRTNTPDEDAYEANAKATSLEETVANINVNQEYLMELLDATDETAEDEESTEDSESEEPAASESTEESESVETSESTTESESASEEAATSETAEEA